MLKIYPAKMFNFFRKHSKPEVSCNSKNNSEQKKVTELLPVESWGDFSPPVHANYFEKNRINYGDRQVEIMNILSLPSNLLLNENLSSRAEKINPILIKHFENNSLKIYTYKEEKQDETPAFEEIASIFYKRDRQLPEVSVLTGNFRPVLRIKDKIDNHDFIVSLFENSKFENEDLKINMNAPQKISFKGRVIVEEGYKSTAVDEIINSYFLDDKFKGLRKSAYAKKLNEDYTMLMLASGFGSRLFPISSLSNGGKPATNYPGGEKTLMELIHFDVGVSSGVIKPEEIKSLISEKKNLQVESDYKIDINAKAPSFIQIYSNPDSLIGDLGQLLQRSRNNLIPKDSPVVVLPCDIYTNADISKTLYDYENSNSGFSMPSFAAEYSQMQDMPPIEVEVKDNFFIIKNFYEKIDDFNNPYYQDILKNAKVKNGDYKDKYFVSGSFFIIHPEVIKLLHVLNDPQKKECMFRDYFYKIFKLLNTDNDIKTFLNDGECKRLKENGFLDSRDNFKPLLGKDKQPLKMTCSVLKDKDGNLAVSKDIGLVKNYFDTMRDIKNNNFTNGLNEQFITSVKNHVDDFGVIFLDKESKNLYERFSQKYNVKNLSGNVIVAHDNFKMFSLKLNADNILKDIDNKNISPEDYLKCLYTILKNSKESKKLILQLTKDPRQSSLYAQKIIKKVGVENFKNWYCSPSGYYENYKKYIEDYYSNAKSVEELLKLMPNWGPWKLNEKHTQITSEKNLTVGSIPSELGNEKNIINILPQLRQGENFSCTINNSKIDFIKKKGGYLHNKFIYEVNTPNNSYIMKVGCVDFDNLRKTDPATKKIEFLGSYEKEILMKNCYLQADSIFLNFCMDKYIELNNSDIVAKNYYYNHAKNFSISEKIGSSHQDMFQNGIIDYCVADMNEKIKPFGEIEKFGIYMNDRQYRNILTRNDNSTAFVDLGYANFIDIFRPSIQKYHIVPPNISGQDWASIYAGMFISLESKRGAK